MTSPKFAAKGVPECLAQRSPESSSSAALHSDLLVCDSSPGGSPEPWDCHHASPGGTHALSSSVPGQPQPRLAHSRDGSSPRATGHQQNRIIGDCKNLSHARTVNAQGTATRRNCSSHGPVKSSCTCPCQMKPLPLVRKGCCRDDSVNSQ